MELKYVGKLEDVFVEDISNFRIDELDVWIEKGHKKEFLSQLTNQDIKLDEIEVVSEQEGAKRYSIMIRAFSKYKVPEGKNWQLNNVFRGEGKLESGTGKGKGWWGDPEGHSKAAKKGRDFIIDFNETFTSLGLKRTKPKEETQKEETPKEYEHPTYLRLGDNIKNKFNDLAKMIFNTKEVSEKIRDFGRILKFQTRNPRVTDLDHRMPSLDQLILLLKEKPLLFRDLLVEANSVRMKANQLLDSVKFAVESGELEKEEPKITFTSLGLKKKAQGWHGEPERHSTAAKKGKKDLTQDSFDGLIEWVRENIDTDDPEGVAWAIAKSRKDKGKSEKDKKRSLKEKSEKWQKTWKQIGASFGRLKEGIKAKKELRRISAPKLSQKTITAKKSKHDLIYIGNLTEDVCSGNWITVHGGDDDPETAGTHVCVEKGQSKKEAIDAKFKGKKEPSKSKEPSKQKIKKEKPKEKVKKVDKKKETLNGKKIKEKDIQSFILNNPEIKEIEADLKIFRKALEKDPGDEFAESFVESLEVSLKESKEKLKEFTKNYFVPNELKDTVKDIHQDLRVSRDLDLNKFKEKINIANNTLINLPNKLQGLSLVFIQNEITDHSDFKELEGKTPKAYEKVGWKRTYDQVSAIFSIEEGSIAVSVKNSKNIENSVNHEVGHGVWEFNLEKNKKEFKGLFNKFKNELIKSNRLYEANDIHEFFAVNFAHHFTGNPKNIGIKEISNFFRKVEKTHEPHDFKEEKDLEIAFKENGNYIYELLDSRDVPKNVAKKLIKSGKARYINSKVAKKGKKDFQGFTLTYIGKLNTQKDAIPLKEFTQLKGDFITEDFVVFKGPIARDGPYDYTDEKGDLITLNKDWDNLKEIYSQYDHLPLKVAEKGSHHAREYGFGFNFYPNEETHEIESLLVLVNDKKFTHVLDSLKEYHVSPGYKDEVRGNKQILLELDHIAMAVGDELSRGCTGKNEHGKSCTKVKMVKHHDQNLEVVI